MDRVAELLRDRTDVCEIVAATILTLPHRHLMSHENLVSSGTVLSTTSRDYSRLHGEVITADLQDGVRHDGSMSCRAGVPSKKFGTGLCP